jgi:hypothetical protein
MGCIGEGKMVLRGERDGFVGLEREEEREERFGGGGGHGRRWEEERRRWEEKWRKLRFDCVW